MPTHPAEVDDVVVQKIMDAFAERYPHLTTVPRRRYRSLDQYDKLDRALADARRQEDYSRVRTELLPLVAEHPLTRDEFAGTDESEVWVGFVVQQAARLLRWYEVELERVKREFEVHDDIDPTEKTVDYVAKETEK